jgi:hypothetical protein
MHRDMKREATRPPAATQRGQKQKFDHFRCRYNDERPHEALADAVPNARWQPSPHAYPERIRAPEYPGDLHVQPVRSTGCFLKRTRRFSARPCATSSSASKKSATASTTRRSSENSTKAPANSPGTCW